MSEESDETPIDEVETDEPASDGLVTFRRKRDGLARSLRTDNVRFTEYDEHDGWERV